MDDLPTPAIPAPVDFSTATEGDVAAYLLALVDARNKLLDQVGVLTTRMRGVRQIIDGTLTIFPAAADRLPPGWDAVPDPILPAKRRRSTPA